MCAPLWGEIAAQHTLMSRYCPYEHLLTRLPVVKTLNTPSWYMWKCSLSPAHKTGVPKSAQGTLVRKVYTRTHYLHTFAHIITFNLEINLCCTSLTHWIKLHLVDRDWMPSQSENRIYWGVCKLDQSDSLSFWEVCSFESIEECVIESIEECVIHTPHYSYTHCSLKLL